MRKGFTLIELIIVVVIIGILATFAMPQFATTKERTLDKDAQANLKLIQAAEKIYRMEMAAYYPDGGSTSVVADINDNLKLSLPASGTNWTYTVTATNPATANATATRTAAGARVWTILLIPGASDIPTCAGTGCP
jgi:prepilin-type N-terminal cleavage/methylation domain-containing protein